MSRIDRIAGEMKKEISEIIKFSIKDPRIPDMLTVTSVDVTGDLRYAKVYISILASNEEKKNAMIALRGAAGFVRREVGQRIQLRYTPEIIFEEDDSIERGMYINELINKTLYPEKEQGIELLENIVDIILDAEQIAILTHTSADGDALGSSFGLAFAMEYLGKNVSVFLEEPIPKSLDFCQDSNLFQNIR